MSRRQRKYRQVLTSNHKGNIAEAAIAFEAIKEGLEVLRPVAEHGRYDLVLGTGARLLRVQCKWGSLNRRLGVVCVRVGGSRHTPRGYVTSAYSANEADAIAVYCAELAQAFVVPIDVVAGQEAFALAARSAAKRPAGLH